jgi:uncharacterized repeat protein (TIGR01451 family)
MTRTRRMVRIFLATATLCALLLFPSTQSFAGSLGPTGATSTRIASGVASPSGPLILSGRLWAYNALDGATNTSPMRVWNLSDDNLVATFVLRSESPYNNGRGVAYDPTDGNIWNSEVDSFNGDGVIHKNPPLGGPDITTIPDPGGVNGPGIGALAYDSETNVLWAAAYQPINGQSLLYELDPSNGDVLATCQVPFQGGGEGNDTLVVAHPLDLGAKKVLLTDGGEILSTLFAIDPETCQVVKTYSIPVGATGIDEDQTTGDLIVSNTSTFYDLGPAPYNTIIGSFPTQGDVEGISIEKTKGADLSVSVAVSPSPALVGRNLTYTLTLRNNGPASALDATLTDPLPPGVRFRSATTSQGTCTGTSTIHCSVGNVAAFTDVVVTIVVFPRTRPGTMLTNTASVTSTTPDFNPGNNSTTIVTTVGYQAL